MISFTQGNKVAVVCGGEYNDKIIRITKEEQEPDRNLDEEDIYDLMDDDDFNKNKYKIFPIKDRLKLTKSLKQHIEPLDEYLVSKYKIVSEKLKEKLKKELILHSGVMVPLPHEQSERIYIAGHAGSGKSCLTAMIAYEYHKMFPKRKIYIFTKHHKEKAYKTIKHVEILCDNEILQNPIQITSLSKSLVIFDDCDHVQDKVINNNLVKLNNDLITGSRKYDTHVITLGHQLMDYKATRNLLNEANRVVFFNSGSKYHTTRYLKVYCGLDPQVIKKITSLKSRWVMISQTIPQYVLHEHGIFII